MPKSVRDGFEREVPGALPVKVDWQRASSGVEVYEIEFFDECGVRRERTLGRDGETLTRDEIINGRRRRR